MSSIIDTYLTKINNGMRLGEDDQDMIMKYLEDEINKLKGLQVAGDIDREFNDKYFEILILIKDSIFERRSNIFKIKT